jgi:DNA adenine methylase
LANPRNQSPLRYPGGKACLTNFISDLANLNRITGGVYVELYAGGAGAALNLLYNGVFSHIHINDYDYAMYAVWFSILNHNEEFVSMIKNTPVTIDEWHHQKAIYERGADNTLLSLGFATFFLNRTNRSGIIYKAGPIGGFNQTGNYLIDVRFNKEDLIKRIQKIAANADSITLTNLDALDILRNLQLYHGNTENLFVYMDPPYYNKGKYLYLNNYNHENHLDLANTIGMMEENIKWLISYDNVREIRRIYRDYRMAGFDLGYTLQTKKNGNELLVFSRDLILSNQITVNSRKFDLLLVNEIADEEDH